jgi:D-3-phosphoglycerate dehydrogenase
MNNNTRGTILITDSLFISAKHEKVIQQAKFDIHRIDNPKLTEDELCNAIKGKIGYILGGVEIVTKRVIEHADKLKAIAFTGAGYSEFIPAYKDATRKGILISNAPGGNADAAAEYAVTLMLMMTRNVINIGRTGNKIFQTTTSLKDKTVGLIGLGKIGLLVANMLRSIGVRDILYYSKHRKYHIESGLGLKFVSKEDLLKRSQIISLHVSKEAGDGFISESDLKLITKDSILVNIAYPEAVDLSALRNYLKEEKFSCAFDRPPAEDFSEIPAHIFFYSNAQTAYNTVEAIETVSEMATCSLLNLLTKSDDAFCINK